VLGVHSPFTINSAEHRPDDRSADRHVTGPRHAAPRRSTARAAGAAAASLLLLAAAGACRSAPSSRPGPVRPGYTERGVASWYGADFHGRRTASGEVYDMHGFTAAHRNLPFDTLIEVRNLTNGRTVVVRITDRGPFARGRIVDLSYAAAREIGLVGPGTARIELRVVPRWPGEPPRPATYAETRFTVQVGAFRDPRRATALQRELARRFPEAAVHTDAGWHRVQVGDFDWRREAESLRRELARLGFTALVVPRV